MAAKSHQQSNKTTKRKQVPATNAEAPDRSGSSKKLKLVSPRLSGPKGSSSKPFKPLKSKFMKTETGEEKKAQMSKRERRIHAKVVYCHIFIQSFFACLMLCF